MPDSSKRSVTIASMRGFSLMELALVLAVIGVLAAATTVGHQVYRSANYASIGSTFVQGWQMAFDAYVEQRGSVPGDDDGTRQINGNGARLCGEELLNEFLEAGIKLPDGRGPGQSHRAVYQDSNGNPQSIEICLETVEWAVPGGSVDDFVTRDRNVMVLHNLTPALARQLDTAIDGKADARFGRFRQQGTQDDTGTEGQPWDTTDRDTMDGRRDGQVTVVTGFYRMNH